MTSKLRTLRQGGFGLACAADIVLARQMRSDGAGGMAWLRVDPLAKGYAQMLLDFPVAVPEEWIELYALGLKRL